MQIENWPVSRLIPYGRNPRKNDQAVERMMASIQEFTFKVPMLVRSNGEVVDGHLRLKAAQKLGMEAVPVILCDEWSETEVKAFRLMVNRSANWAEWDMDLVALEMEDLKALHYNIQLTGFDPVEIDGLLFGHPVAEPDDVIAEPPAVAITRPGDLWQLGPHRVLCSDAISAEAVAVLCGSAQPALMITDPPYGVEYDPGWRERAGLGRPRQRGTIPNDDQVDWSPAYRLFSGNVAYVWHAGVHAAEVAAGLEAAGLCIRAQIVWAKQHFALSRGDYHWQHEPCWYCVRAGQRSNWCGDRTQSTLWQVPNLNPIGGANQEPATGHGAQKPIELMRRPILNHTARGDIIYDPFLGSGTTLMAAELTERICYGLEIEPRYVDVILSRWQKHTGKLPVLQPDQRTFDQVAAERSPAPVEG
jgi:DNA modification methylase